MKKLFLSIFAIAIITGAQAQNAKKDAAGNFIAIKAVPKPGKATGKTITDTDGKSYPVFQAASGKLYFEKQSKAGNLYRKYLKVEA